MDCLTISTFRSLEQQAIRQYRELKATENGRSYISRETFGQEKPYTVRELPYINNTVKTKSAITGINYYA